MLKIKFNIWLIGPIYLFLSGMLHAQDLHTQEAALPCLNKSFSIAAHLVRDSLGEKDLQMTAQQIEEALQGVNAYFAPICARFEVCEWDTIHNYQYDSLQMPRDYLWEEMRSKYYADKRINMYFISGFRKANAGGFAVERIDRAAGGIVIAKISDLTLAHELGHYFGLKHTYEGNGEELVDGSNCRTKGDGICDTPADPYNPDMNIQWVDSKCRFIFTGVDAIGQYYRPDVGNIMSAYGDCRCGFTREQYRRMAAIWLQSDRANW